VVIWVCDSLRISQRRACRVLGQARSTQRQGVGVSGEEERLVTRIVALATQYSRYGYRRITALIRAEGWRVNHKRVERILEARRVKGTPEATQEGEVMVQ
jgi:putative transposase